MRLSRALFALPTLFTLSSVLMGMISIVSAAEGDFEIGALAILFAVLFDSLDGRVARLTRTESKFGVQIDSLADVVSFGVAPAVLAYLGFLRGRFEFGPLDLGLAGAFLFLAAGAIRLARYNVDADRKPGPVRTFTGLPIPGGAGCIAGLVLGLTLEEATLGATTMLGFLLLLSFLMVSTVKYRKKVDVRAPDTLVLLGLLVLTLLLVAAVRPAFTAFSFFAFYMLSGLAESTLLAVVRVVRRARPSRRVKSDARGDSDVS
ncbi:MAG: CDP-diacylglycerol--serine O-phosphatidyltransferase [Deltaproteobacteria bacterium]|nr:CDP-diacylglycerol--serine O-phosphatidyltransferase [Deltaproteobacteria bacterium]